MSRIAKPKVVVSDGEMWFGDSEDSSPFSLHILSYV